MIKVQSAWNLYDLFFRYLLNCSVFIIMIFILHKWWDFKVYIYIYVCIPLHLHSVALRKRVIFSVQKGFLLLMNFCRRYVS